MLEVGKLTLWLFAVASWAGIFLVGMKSDEVVFAFHGTGTARGIRHVILLEAVKLTERF